MLSPPVTAVPKISSLWKLDNSAGFPPLWDAFSIPCLLQNRTEDLGYPITICDCPVNPQSSETFHSIKLFIIKLCSHVLCIFLYWMSFAFFKYNNISSNLSEHLISICITKKCNIMLFQVVLHSTLASNDLVKLLVVYFM